jgi:hypothetical protein
LALVRQRGERIVRIKYSDPALAAFAGLAEAYCVQVINGDSRSSEDLLSSAHRLLPQIYSAALQLPSTSVLFDDGDSSGDAAEDSSTRAMSEPVSALPTGLSRLAEFLGQRRFYREIFDPYSDVNESEVTGDIIDDLCDIHRDLVAGLLQWRQGNTGQALWEWRFGFETHWGEHLTSALRAIFALSAWRDVPWPTGPS